MADPRSGLVGDLAALYGVQTSYRDVFDRVQKARVTSLLATLRALGAAVDGPDDVPDAVHLRRRELWGRMLEPVSAGFDRSSVPVGLRLPRRRAGQRVTCHLTLEEGEPRTWTQALTGLPLTGQADVDGVPYASLELRIRDLPHGYHRLVVELDGDRGETLLVVAPARAYPLDRRAWGAFLPLHALRTHRDWGAGDLSDLAALAGWADGIGGGIVGTLPLLPVYLGGERVPFDPSPYSPLSRLFWNELTLDLGRAPELACCEAARELLASGEVAGGIAGLRRLRYVDYKRLADLKGRVLGALARCFFDDPGARGADLEQFLAERPEAADYANFRGAVARYGAAWWEWPDGLGERSEPFDAVDGDEARTHLYAQLLAREQVAALALDLRRAGQRPYLDLPIGARGDGYDVWRHREVFARQAVAGAPPDAIFTGGQNWDFPPLHPGRLREQGYAYFIAVLRHHLRLADLLRIDHVMGLHRLYWIPEGMDARDGVYVRYPADEWYAILTLESHRHRSCIVGENLGTVPAEVQETLQERGIVRMYVVQYETETASGTGSGAGRAGPDAEEVLGRVPDDVVASVNTHDMPPFGAWWAGRDVDDGLDLGLLDEAQATEARAKRGRVRRRVVDLLVTQGHLAPEASHDPAAVHAALLAWLGASGAPVVLVNLEDLWLERLPQNTPGTRHERPNWRRRASAALEEFDDRPDVVEPLRRLDSARAGEGGRDLMGDAHHGQ